MHSCSLQRPDKVPEPIELELQMTESCHAHAGNWTLVLWKGSSSQCSYHWPISLVAKIILIFSFFIDFYWAVHFSLLPFLSLPSLLQPSSRSPCSQFTQEILSFSTFNFPCRLDLCKFLLLSSLLSKFSGIVVCMLVVFPLCLKTTYE